MRRICSLSVVCAAFGLLFATSVQARTYSLTAGPPGKTGNSQLDMDAFYTSSVKIHVGDKVKWAMNGFHTVTFVPKGQATPAFAGPSSSLKVSGVNDAAGKAFWFNGLPLIVINPIAAFGTTGRTVTGKTLVSSAIPTPGAAPKPVTFKFTKVGTFKYVCLVHRKMKGVVRVVAKSKKVPTPAQVKKAAKTRFKADLALAKTQAAVTPPANTVLVGHDKADVAWLRFFPSTITVKVGQPVTFQMGSANELHTVTFGPAAYNGNIEANLNSVIPAAYGLPTLAFNPQASYPSDPPPTLPPNDGTNHGNGFENSGFLDTNASTPQGSTATFTFAKAGTYTYECLIHGGMDGTVVVTP